MPDTELWKTRPDPHDFPAAADYLTLLLPEREVRRVIAALRKAPTLRKKAKDLLRASRLPILPPTNVHVKGDLKKVRRGQRLSPVLLVRGSLRRQADLTVADGYHRICASYELDENADIPCRIADM